MAESTVPGSKPGQKKLMKKLKASQARNAAGRAKATTARAQTKAPKTSGGTMSSRMQSVKVDGGAKVNPGKYQKMPTPKGGQVKPFTAGSAAGALARGALRVAGPVGALVGMTKEAGAGSDKPSGPLMKGNKRFGDEGVRKTTNKYDSGVKLSKLEVIDDQPAKVNKPSSTASQGKKADNPTKKVGFKGNWKDAAPFKAAKNLKEATRRNESDSYLKNKLKPKKTFASK